MTDTYESRVGLKVPIPNHFTIPVTIEAVTPLGAAFLLQVRTSEGKLEETVLAINEADVLLASTKDKLEENLQVSGEDLRLLIESRRIRLAYRYDPYFAVKAKGIIDREVAITALEMLEVDQKGFDHMDRTILLTLIDKFDGGPVGIDSLASAIGEEKSTLEHVYEPYLIQEGYLQRTTRGRLATRIAYEHLGRKWITGRQEWLF